MVKVGRTARQLHVLRHVPDWRATLALQMPSTNSHVAANLQKVIYVLVGLLIQRISCQLLLWNAGFGKLKSVRLMFND